MAGLSSAPIRPSVQRQGPAPIPGTGGEYTGTQEEMQQLVKDMKYGQRPSGGGSGSRSRVGGGGIGGSASAASSAGFGGGLTTRPRMGGGGFGGSSALSMNPGMPGSPAPVPQAPMSNTATQNPTISKINETQMKRAEGDMNFGNLARASDIAIRDNAENERKAARQNAASRGVSGGGIEDLQQGAITRDTLRSQTGARVDLANDAEGRRDALYGQIAGQEVAEKNLQMSQLAEARNLQAQYAQQQQSARDAELRQFRDIMDLFGSDSGGLLDGGGSGGIMGGRPAGAPRVGF